MKHAPGEWRIEKRMDCIAIVDNDGKEIVFLFNKGSVTTQLRTKDELESNAQLIAAAPKLLDALKNSHKWLMKICQSDIAEKALKMSFNEKELTDNLEAINQVEGK